MTVESLQANGNQIQISENEANSATLPAQDRNDSSEPDKGALALSVKEGAQKSSQSLNLARRPASMLPGNRPIEPSHLNVIGSYTSVGSMRPISASEMHVSGTLRISGNRPVSSSTLNISQNYTVMGNRPVASNETEDPASLLEYLD